MVLVRIPMEVRHLVGCLQVIAQAHDRQHLLRAGMAERGAHQREGEMPLPLLELLQGNASPSDGKEMEVAALGVLKKVPCLHARLEGVEEALGGHRKLPGDLRRINGVGRRSIPAGLGNQPQHPDNADEQTKTSQAAHGDPFHKKGPVTSGWLMTYTSDVCWSRPTSAASNRYARALPCPTARARRCTSSQL